VVESDEEEEEEEKVAKVAKPPPKKEKKKGKQRVDSDEDEPVRGKKAGKKLCTVRVKKGGVLEVPAV
jgi:hypothetical protein